MSVSTRVRVMVRIGLFLCPCEGGTLVLKVSLPRAKGKAGVDTSILCRGIGTGIGTGKGSGEGKRKSMGRACACCVHIVCIWYI